MKPDRDALAKALTECDELAFANIHAEWARRSIAAALLANPDLWPAEAEQRAVNDGVRLAARLVRDHVLGETGERVATFLEARADRVIPPGESATQDGAP